MFWYSLLSRDGMPFHPPQLDVFLGGRLYQKDDQMAQYDSTFTIPLGIKLFLINVDFFQLLAMLKVLKFCWTLFLSTCLKLGGVMCIISTTNGMFFLHLNCVGNLGNFNFHYHQKK
jgi:hypothetical protein